MDSEVDYDLDDDGTRIGVRTVDYQEFKVRFYPSASRVWKAIQEGQCFSVDPGSNMPCYTAVFNPDHVVAVIE